jgi:NAD(P)-dependent dehydrogenase (short-subunit alcohol dehydrogenase family)
MPLKNPFDFSGKSVLLTGATGGLGRPITLAFAQTGAKIALCDINEEALSKMAPEIKGLGGQVLTAKVDLCAPKEVENFVRLVREKYQKIDILVNLVGGIIRKPSIDYPLDEWQRVMDINLKACWVACQIVGKVMIEQKGGRIINFSSNAGMHGIPGYPAYSPAKAGVIALTKVLAVEWGPLGICTNALSPGFTKTPFNADVLNDPKRVEGILRRMPMGQVLPDDALVGPTLFLASDAARWINGHTINVDSGFNVT